MGQNILDVGGFDELEAAVFDEVDAFAHQLDFQVESMKTGTEEYGDVRQGNPFAAQFTNFIDNKP